MGLIDPTPAQQRIDQQIADYEEAISKLKTARNTHSHISQLPPEVLAVIFHHTQRATVSYAARGWLMVLSVCTAWRQLALDTPRLWSTIVLSGHSQDEVLLKRSKSTPLQVYVDISRVEPSVIETISATVRRETHRLRDLKVVSAKETQMLAFLEASSCTQAPNLQRVKLHSNAETSVQFQESMKKLQWVLPSLRHLSTVFFRLPLPFPTFCNLTELIILLVHGSNDHFGVASAVQVLGHYPLLERVEIGQLSALDDDEAMLNPGTHILQPEPSVRVSLSRLKALRILANDIRQLRILKHLEFPPMAQLDLYCSTTPPDGVVDASPLVTDWSLTAADLARRDSQLVMPLRSSIVDGMTSFTVYFSVSNDPVNRHLLSFHHPHPITPFLEAINIFSPTVTQLTLTLLIYETAKRLWSLPHIFSEVETLIVQNCHLRVLEALMSPPGLLPNQTQNDNTSGGDLCLPKLKRIVFSLYKMYAETLVPGETHANLIRFIQTRKLESVGLIDCQASQAVRDQLSENNVSPVLWDSEVQPDYN